MSQSPPLAQLRARLRGKQVQLDAVRAEAPREERSEPAAGDLYVIPAAAAPQLEWLVVDVCTEDGTLEVVPADTGVLVGSADMEIPKPATTGSLVPGPLVLRCAYLQALPTALFEARWRSGRLDAESLARVRDKLLRLRDGTVNAGGDELETEGDPDYQQWRQSTIEPALRRLALTIPANAGRLLDFQHARASRRTGMRRVLGSWALAASALLVVSLTLAGGLLWQSDQVTDVQERLAEQAAAREQVNASHEAELERLQAAHRDEVADWGRRLEAAKQAGALRSTNEPRNEPRVSLPVAWLLPSSQRSDAREIEIRQGVETLPIFLLLEDVPAYPSYRIELFDTYDQRSIWTTLLPTLGTTVVTDLCVELPQPFLVPGEYQLRLQGLRDDGSAETFAAYRFDLATSD